MNIRTVGRLIDLSETGALIQLPRAQEPGSQITLSIEGMQETVHLAGRVIRSAPLLDEDATHSEGPAQYRVAVEFLDVGGEVAARVRRIARSHRPL